MITQEDEYFLQNWEECLYVIEAAKLLMDGKLDHGWDDEMMSKWIVKDEPDPEPEQAPDPEAEPPTEEEVLAKEDLKKEKEAAEASAEADRLMGKYEKWEDIRKHLWFHYTNEEARSTTMAPWRDEE